MSVCTSTSQNKSRLTKRFLDIFIGIIKFKNEDGADEWFLDMAENVVLLGECFTCMRLPIASK